MVGNRPSKKKQIQIDIVGRPVEGNDYIIGSCKYRNEKIGLDELELIREYAAVFGKGTNYHYYISRKADLRTDYFRHRNAEKYSCLPLPIFLNNTRNALVGVKPAGAFLVEVIIKDL